MTNLFQKIADTITTDLNEILNTKEQSTPSSLLNQYIQSCEKETENIEKLITRHQELKKQIQKELDDVKYLITKRTKQANIAKVASAQELELQALKDLDYYNSQSLRITTLYSNVEQEIFQLQQQLQDMKNKLSEMKLKRLELMSRENVAYANRRINDSMNKFTDKNPYFRFEDAEQQVQDLEISMESGYAQTDFDVRIAKLEKELENNNTANESESYNTL